MSDQTIRVSAPASSGNLGPGFDVLGAAIDLRNEVEASAGSGTVTVEGEGEGTLPEDATNLVARAFEIAAPGRLGEVDLHCRNRIPPARGLGSSTAAAACGLVAGWEWAGHEWDEDELADRLAELDGHADNAAACAHGGIVIVMHEEDGTPDMLSLGPCDWLVPVLVVPDRELSTGEARAALPDEFPRADVVRSIGAAATLAAGLVGGHVELVEDALEGDALHEGRRGELVPELADMRAALAGSPALGTTLSGAGPTVVAWCRPRDVDPVVATLQIEDPDLRVERSRIADEGARREQ